VKRWPLIIIHAFLAVQIALPLHYYAGRADKNDERFAWRMFSPVRMIRCGHGPDLRSPPEFRVDGRPIAPGQIFHEAWLTIAGRGRADVIEAMALELCRRNPGKAVGVRYSCRQLDGEVRVMSSGGFDVCRTGAL
jgi:hypothetical protein